MAESLVDRHEVEKLLVITGALEGGLIDALAEAEGPPPGAPATAAEVAERAGTDDRATRVMLEALLDLGLLEASEEDPSGPAAAVARPGAVDPDASADAAAGPAAQPDRIRYSLTPAARRHLVDPGPDLERNSLLHQASKARGWLDLPYVLEHGGPRPRERTESGLRAFVRTMAEGDPGVLDEVVERVLAYAAQGSSGKGSGAAGGRPARMLDAGGAVGHVALRFDEAGLRATLCDRPEVIEEAREYQGERADRIDLLACDFTEDLPEGPFDVVYFGNVFHIYGPETNAALARRAYARLGPGGVVAIRDFVAGRSPRAALFAVNMLQATEAGGVWREDQFRDWLQGAGFVDVAILDLERSANQLVLGRRV